MQNYLDKIEKRNYSKRVLVIAIIFILLAIASIATAVFAYFNGIRIPFEHGGFGHIGLGHGNSLLLSFSGYVNIWLVFLSLMWIIIGILYWITVIEWIYKIAKIYNLNTALWPLLGAFFNIVAVFAIMIIISQPKYKQGFLINNTSNI